jgi:broad specificity phosphatase PhoE
MKRGDSCKSRIPAARRIAIALAAAVLLLAPFRAFASDESLWEGLRSGRNVALLRHALAPGTGDPAGFSLEDCGTQRNLSDAGRAQAARIGEQFRAHGVRHARLFTSQWCRCRDTARLLGLGPVEDLALLNSFFTRSDEGETQTRALAAWLAAQKAGPPLVLVTHQVNITRLTGLMPAEGEIVVLARSADGRVTAVGRIREGVVE